MKLRNVLFPIQIFSWNLHWLEEEKGKFKNFGF